MSEWEQPEQSEETLIRASEINEFVYCHRQWWLKRIHGRESRHVRALQRGTKYHEQHGRRVQTAEWIRYVAYGFLITAAALLLYGWLFA